MESIYKCSESGLEAVLIRGAGAERDRAEREVLDAGAPLPLLHRAIWAANPYPWEPWFLLVRDANGKACAGVGMERIRSRSMPGYAILRMRRFGGNLSSETCRVALEAAAMLAKNGSRILRLQVNVFARENRDAIAGMLKELGFREIIPPSTYRYTLAIDLRPSEEAIFASLGRSARSRIRETLKKSLRSVMITDPAYAGRIEELQQQALQRTGGHIALEDWPNVINMSVQYPNLSRVFGLFVGDDISPNNMDAFGWVCCHGDHGEYRAAGSTRRTDVRIPFGYLLVWEMIRWSKAAGAEWFDMGGVTLPDEDEPELKGISDFKRYFSQNVMEVGAEWVLEPAPIRARIADLVSNGVQYMREWAGKWPNIKS